MYFLIILLLFEQIHLNIIIFPFTKKWINSINIELFTEISIGTPPQRLPSILTFDSYSIYIPDDTFKNCIFNQLDSKTLIPNLYDKILECNFEDNSIPCSTAKDIGLVYNEEKDNNLFTIYFILLTNYSNTYNFNGSLIGLKNKPPSSKILTHLIWEMKTNSLIDNYVFKIQYKNDNEGELIIGNYPHEYNNDFEEKNLRLTDGNALGDGWSIKFSNIISDNYISNINIGKFSLSIAGIVVPEDYSLFLNETFFKKYFTDNICKIQIINAGKNNYFYQYICDKRFNANYFRNLKFENKNLNYTFEFTQKDLFFHYNNYIYSLIIFSNKKINSWILGEIFIKKYQLIFEPNESSIGIYLETQKMNVYYVIFSILIISVFILIYLSYKQLITKKRKIRANELEENIDYTSKEDYKKYKN